MSEFLYTYYEMTGLDAEFDYDWYITGKMKIVGGKGGRAKIK